jgi:hypothetical protein
MAAAGLKLNGQKMVTLKYTGKVGEKRLHNAMNYLLYTPPVVGTPALQNN